MPRITTLIARARVAARALAVLAVLTTVGCIDPFAESEPEDESFADWHGTFSASDGTRIELDVASEGWGEATVRVLGNPNLPIAVGDAYIATAEPISASSFRGWVPSGQYGFIMPATITLSGNLLTIQHEDGGTWAGHTQWTRIN